MRAALIVALVLAGVAAAYLQSHSSQRSPRRYAGMSDPEARVFARACKDCHSSETEWPWYSRLPGISVGLAADVRRGRAAWNISNWNSYSDGKRLGFLTAITIDAANDHMPPRAYQWMHRESKLSHDDRMLLVEWAKAERARLRAAKNSVAMASPVVSR